MPFFPQETGQGSWQDWSLAKRLKWSGALFFCGLSRFEILPLGAQVYGDEGKIMGAKSFFGLRERVVALSGPGAEGGQEDGK